MAPDRSADWAEQLAHAKLLDINRFPDDSGQGLFQIRRAEPEFAYTFYHVHPWCELGILLSGTMCRYELREARPLTLGDMWFYGPLEPHGALVASPETMWMIMMCPPSFICELSSARPSPYLPFIRTSLRPAIQPRTDEEKTSVIESFEQMLAESNAKHPGYVTSVQVELIRLLIWLLRLVPDLDPKTSGIDARSAAIIDVANSVRQSLSEELTIEKAASQAHMSRRTFIRTFKRVTGSTFCAYLLGCRAEAAQHQICSTDEKMSVIAIRCGFADASHMCRVIKEKFGATPQAMREQTRAQQRRAATAGASLPRADPQEH